MDLRSQLLFDMTAEVRERYPIENTPRGTRVNVSVAGGTFAGPKLKGIILPGGGDFALMQPDGVLEIDARITLRTDDGQNIYMTYRGLTLGVGNTCRKSNEARQSLPRSFTFGHALF